MVTVAGCVAAPPTLTVTRPNMVVSGVVDVQPVKRIADIVRNPSTAVSIGIRQQQCELFAAIARGEVRRALRMMADHQSYGAKAIVAGLMPILVIVFLEVVDIDQEQAQFKVVAFGARPFLRQRFVELTSIGEAGEAVGPRQ